MPDTAFILSGLGGLPLGQISVNAGVAQSVAQLSCKQQVTSSSLVASSLAMVPGLRAFRYSFNVSAPEGESPYVAVSEVE